MKLERSQFLKEVKEQFPELGPRLNAEEGLSTFEMDVFCEFTQRNINEGEREVVIKCFKIAEKYYRESNQSFKNVVAISFVENLLFKNTKKNLREWAWEIFPEILKAEYTKFHGVKSI
jgi:hypothetical protein